MLKLEEIKQFLEIDLTSPSGLKWKISKGRRGKVGETAGSLNNTGYYLIKINRRLYSAHRIVYSIFHNLELSQLPKELDHIDRNKTNNSPLNLRPATRSQNCRNTNTHVDSLSKVKGVSWKKQNKKWQAHIWVDGKGKYLGLFIDIEDAKKAYEEAAIEYYGEFSNF